LRQTVVTTRRKLVEWWNGVSLYLGSNLFSRWRRRESNRLGYPRPYPRLGTGVILENTLPRNGFVPILALVSIPEFGRFFPLTRLSGCAWPHGHARPKTSLVAHATNEYTHGRVKKSLKIISAVKRKFFAPVFLSPHNWNIENQIVYLAARR
jgi:hypothetical protein